MKILHVNFEVGFRGGEQQVLYLIDGLRRKEVDQVLIAPADQPLAQRVTALGVYVEDANAGRFTWRFIKQVVKRHAIDLVHAHEGKAHTACWLANLFGGCFDFVVHRRVYRAPQRNLGPFGKYKHPRLKSLICVSEAVAELHRRSAAVDTYIKVINSAAEIENGFNPYKLHKILGLPEQTRIVGTIAAFAPEKDTSTFVKTCFKVAGQFSDVHFVHIGGGSDIEQQKFEAEVQTSEVAGRIHFLGFRPDALILLDGFKIFLFTSKWEGMGSSIVQAQLRGLPVVSTAAGGTPEALDNGKSGVLAPVGAVDVLAKAVSSYLLDDKRYNEHSEHAKVFAQKFKLEKMVSATFSLYQKVIANST